MSFIGSTVTASTGANGAATPTSSDVIGFSGGGVTTQVGQTGGTQLPVADPVLAAAQTNDAPLSVFISGDPQGDFAGVNLLEQVMTDGTGLAFNVKAINQASYKVDQNNALVPSDAPAFFEVEVAQGAQYIIDTTGYQTVLIQQQNVGSSIFLEQSNDNLSYVPASAVQLLGGQQTYPTSVTQVIATAVSQNSQSPQAMYAVPVSCKYLRLTGVSAIVPDTFIYLRQVPFSSYQTYFTVNPPQGTQLNAYNQTVNPNGTVNVAYNFQGTNSPTPTFVGGIDQTNTARAVKTDGFGNLLLRGAPTQVGQQSIEELLTQILGTLRVLTHYKYEEQLMAGFRSSADEPDNMLADYLNPASNFNNMTN